MVVNKFATIVFRGHIKSMLRYFGSKFRYGISSMIVLKNEFEIPITVSTSGRVVFYTAMDTAV